MLKLQPLKITVLGVESLGGDEVMRVELHGEALIRRGRTFSTYSLSAVGGHSKKTTFCEPARVLIMNQISRYLNLGLYSLQNYEK